MTILHWLLHVIHWQPCEVVWEESDVPRLIVLRCVTCGKKSVLK